MHERGNDSAAKAKVKMSKTNFVHNITAGGGQNETAA